MKNWLSAMEGKKNRAREKVGTKALTEVARPHWKYKEGECKPSRYLDIGNVRP